MQASPILEDMVVTIIEDMAEGMIMVTGMTTTKIMTESKIRATEMTAGRVTEKAKTMAIMDSFMIEA